MEALSIIITAGIAILCSPALVFVFGNPRYLKNVTQKTDNLRISIIIPARDEEENITTLLQSITQQDLKPHETIVVDDGSTDQTTEMAKKHGASVIAAPSLPSGWKGKPWACQQGANYATGDWLLFLDADTRLQTTALSLLAATTEQGNGNHVTSVSPHHRIKKPYEELSAFFNLLMVTGVNAFGLGKGSQNNSALFGQCMLISKETYAQVGGHSRVKSYILENFHLARHLKSLGIQLNCYLGKDVLSMRMFPSGFTELWNSWKKGFSSGAAQSAPRALILSSIWISGAMFAIVSSGITLFSDTLILKAVAIITYMIYAIQSLFIFRKIGSFSPINALFFPISLLFYQTLFFVSILSKKRGKTTQWKGRDVS